MVQYATIIISVLAIIMLVNPIINSGVSVKGLVSNSTSTGNNNTNAPQVIFNDKPNHICLDGDAADDVWWKGFADGMNDQHHIKRSGVTYFNDSSAETGYHNGYQKGWTEARVNGTMLDESCWTG